MSAKIEGKNLVLTIPLQKAALSKSGKSQIVASTGGFTPTTATVDGKSVRVSVNAII
jgi:hypothetical protein